MLPIQVLRQIAPLKYCLCAPGMKIGMICIWYVLFLGLLTLCFLSKKSWTWSQTATLTIIDNQPCVRTEGLLNEQRKPERKVFCTNKEGESRIFYWTTAERRIMTVVMKIANIQYMWNSFASIITHIVFALRHQLQSALQLPKCDKSWCGYLDIETFCLSVKYRVTLKHTFSHRFMAHRPTEFFDS